MARKTGTVAKWLNHKGIGFITPEGQESVEGQDISVHFEQIKQCIKQSVPEYSFDACQASLLTFYYTLVYTLLWFPLYPLAAHFCRLVYFYFYFYLRTYGQSD